MLTWRARAQLRRRARRRYLAIVHRRWLEAGAPRRFGQPSQTLVTLLWLVVPAAVAALGASLMWLVSRPDVPSDLPDMRILAGLLLVPILSLVLLRRR
jgi:hypothetical protein